MPLPLILLGGAALIGLGKLLSSGSSSSEKKTDYDEGCGNYDYSGDHAGRWTQNEINVQHNIDAGMAVKED